MNIKQLNKLISEKESQTLEFKKSTGQLHPAFETICAFLNTQGGTVIIGVNSKGQIEGQDISDSTRQAIANEINKLEPAVRVDVNYISVNKEKYVISLSVKTGPHAPYIYDGRPYQRNQSTTSRMSQHRYEQLLVERGQLNHNWEDIIATKYNIDDLDHDEIRHTILEGIRVNRIPSDAMADTVEAALNRMELLYEGNLKNAAIVLFAKKVFPDYAQCLLKMGKFKGTSIVGDFIDNQQVYGNIFKILSEADNFIRRHLPIASLFSNDSFERIDEPALPALALREAMVNAVCHRDYSDQQSAITLAIFDDRLAIWNSGTLPPKLKLDDLRKSHTSFPRNKLIANVLYSRKFFEKWGSGTNKMIELCHDQKLPEPVFEEYSGGLEVSFKFKQSLAVTSQQKVLPSNKNLSKVRQNEIVRLLQDNNLLSANEIYAKLHSPPSLRTVKADLSFLKKQGVIEQQGKSLYSVWKIKK